MLTEAELERIKTLSSHLPILELELSAVFTASGSLAAPPVEQAYLPLLLRGGWGYRFKEICCDQPDWQTKHHCPEDCQCAYQTIFASRQDTQLSSLGQGRHIPRPYRIQGPEISSQVQAGQTFRFHFSLYGSAIQAWEPCLAAWLQLTEHGLGRPRQRVPFQLTSIVNRSQADTLIWTWDQPDQILPPKPRSLAPLTLDQDPNFLHLSFTSPTLLAVQGRGKKLAPWQVTPAHLAQMAVNRLLRTAEIWSEQPVEPIRVDYLTQSQPSLLGYAQTHKIALKRGSRQEGNQQPISGWQGNLLFHKELTLFAELLGTTSTLGLGQNTTIGFGDFVLHPLYSNQS